jgi:hypothetical protein
MIDEIEEIDFFGVNKEAVKEKVNQDLPLPNDLDVFLTLDPSSGDSDFLGQMGGANSEAQPETLNSQQNDLLGLWNSNSEMTPLEMKQEDAPPPSTVADLVMDVSKETKEYVMMVEQEGTGSPSNNEEPLELKLELASNQVKSLLQKAKGLETTNRMLQEENSQLQATVNELTIDNGSPDEKSNEKRKGLETTNRMLQEENSQLQQQIYELKFRNENQQQPQAPSSPMGSAQVEKLLKKLKGLESMNHRLQDGNSQLQEQVKEANEQTTAQDQLTISDLQQQLQDAKSSFSRTMSNGSFDDDDDDKESSSDDDELHNNGAIQRLSEMQNTIDTLQRRIMVLVDDKLELQTALDSLEHQSQSQFVDVELAAEEQIKKNKETNNNERGRRKSWLPFSPANTKEQVQEHQQQTLPVPIAIDKDSSQADILKQTMARKRASSLGGRLSGIFGPTDEDYEIDKEALRELSDRTINNNNNNGQGKTNLSGGGGGGFTSLSNDQFDKSVEQFEVHRKSSWNDVNDSNNNPRDTTDIAGGFLESVTSVLGAASISSDASSATTTPANGSTHTGMSIKQEEKIVTTWDRMYGYVYAMPEKEEIDYEKLHKLRAMAVGERQDDEIDFLNTPSSMLQQDETKLETPSILQSPQIAENRRSSAKPAFMKSQSNDSDIDPVEDGHASVVAAPLPTFPPVDPNKPKTIVGPGMQIDQSNLLGVYVNKKRESTSSTFGYLTSMILGDDTEDITYQEKLLKGELAKKKREDELRAQDLAELEAKKVEETAEPVRPRTMLSGRL